MKDQADFSVLGQLTYPMTIDELVEETGLEEPQVRNVLGTLMNLSMIEVRQEDPEAATALVKKERLPLDLLIPEVRNPHFHEKLEVRANEHSFISEQFKSLKVRINEIRSYRPVQVINVTSPSRADGKSLVSANLALCCSKDTTRRNHPAGLRFARPLGTSLLRHFA
ncbi:MAG: hypothetical protein ACRD1R_17080 [Acidobacteriota bacterium]